MRSTGHDAVERTSNGRDGNTDFLVARTEGEAPEPCSNALLSGWRVTARPWKLLEVGLTRMVQFGGTGHPETLGSLARAVVGAHANAQTVAAQSRDSGNGLAGVDLRLRCLFGIRCAGYAPVMGEDDRKHLPFKYLETAGALGWIDSDWGQFSADRLRPCRLARRYLRRAVRAGCARPSDVGLVDEAKLAFRFDDVDTRGRLGTRRMDGSLPSLIALRSRNEHHTG